MLIRRTTKSNTLAFVSVLAFASMATVAQAQSGSKTASDIYGQMAKLGGAMHATAKICGGYSEKQLIESKQQQQKMQAQRGMSEASFEQTYSQGMQQAEERWQALSAAEQDEACENIKRQAMGMTK